MYFILNKLIDMYQSKKQSPIQSTTILSQVSDVPDFYLPPGAIDDQLFQLYQISLLRPEAQLSSSSLTRLGLFEYISNPSQV